MLVSGGAAEPMVWSNENADNVLLEWETAVMAGQKNICVPQPVFINDNLKGIKGLDDASKFLKSENCPKLRPNKPDAHKWAASKTLYEVKQIQGVQLDVNEVSWSIPDLIKALQTYAPLQMKAAANQCATEASFFQQFPDTSFDSTEFDIKFLSSFDLKELFGSEKEKKHGILEYRKSLKNLSVSFRTNPRMSRNSMEILTHGLKQNYSFLKNINLSGANLADKQTWNLLTAALKVNDQLETLNLTDNDLTGLHDLYKAIKNHNSITSCRVGSNFGFESTSLLRDGIQPSTYYLDMDAASLLLLTELWEYGKPDLELIVFSYININVKEEDVPDSLGLLLGKLPGLKTIEIQSEALIGALTTCIVNSASITEITIALSETAKPATKKKSGTAAGGKAKDSGSNKIEKKQSQPWMKPLCDALVCRGKELAKQAALKTAAAEAEVRNAAAAEHEHGATSEHEISLTESVEQVKLEEAEEGEEESDDECGSEDNNIIEDHKLSLTFNNLGLTDQDVSLLANAFRKMKNGLGYLIMDENEISAVGFSSLLKVFTNACTVDGLSLDGNNIGPGCAKDLHKFAREATGLSGLYLARNPLGDAAVKMLFEGLALNEKPTIERLSLQQTNIADNAARAISTAIEELSALDMLDLSKNDFTSNGFVALAPGLNSNKSLKTLTLSDMPMDAESVDAFVEALKNPEDRTLENLDVSRCQLGDASAAKILNLSSKDFLIDMLCECVCNCSIDLNTHIHTLL
ncbi:hypothetical protein BJ741DRAFT_437574 [Chytriomyces cf. hyalinus JEL632]|nr:hypothetical protein BJ741DRAFT_437574 [Chytriomyces cf. hyalinus JEL632]